MNERVEAQGVKVDEWRVQQVCRNTGVCRFHTVIPPETLADSETFVCTKTKENDPYGNGHCDGPPLFTGFRKDD